MASGILWMISTLLNEYRDRTYKADADCFKSMSSRGLPLNPSFFGSGRWN